MLEGLGCGAQNMGQNNNKGGLMKTVVLALALILSTSLYADDYEKRLEAAYQYLEVMPVKANWFFLVDKVIYDTIPITKRTDVVPRMKQLADFDRMEKEYAEIMAKYMTLDQITFMTGYYKSNPGLQGLKDDLQMRKATERMFNKEAKRVYKLADY